MADVLEYHGAVTGRWTSGRTSHTIYPLRYMVVTGELTEGFTFYGPFKTVDRAVQWATTNLKSGTPRCVQNMFDVRDNI